MKLYLAIRMINGGIHCEEKNFGAFLQFRQEWLDGKRENVQAMIPEVVRAEDITDAYRIAVEHFSGRELYFPKYSKPTNIEKKTRFDNLLS